MEMVVLLTVLQSSGRFPFPHHRVCPTRYRKQTHYSISNLLIAIPNTQKPEFTDTSIWKLCATSKFNSNWGGRGGQVVLHWTLRRRIGRRLSCALSKNLISWDRMGLLTSIKQGQLPFGAPSSVLTFCLKYSNKHSKCPSRAEMEAWRWH